MSDVYISQRIKHILLEQIPAIVMRAMSPEIERNFLIHQASLIRSTRDDTARVVLNQSAVWCTPANIDWSSLFIQ